MTTSIRMESAQDLFVENEVMNLNQTKFKSANSLAGVSWLAGNRLPHDTLVFVLKSVLALVKDKLPHLELWLLAGTSAWQPNTSVVRHYKLWGALRARGLNVPSRSQSMEEAMIESEGKLKLFGAAKLSEFNVEDIAQILLKEHCSYIAALPSNVPPSALLNVGWSGDLVVDSNIIDRLAESDALLLKQVGEFDDHERGVVAIGRRSIVSSLLA